jgi:hypothetical protein
MLPRASWLVTGRLNRAVQVAIDLPTCREQACRGRGLLLGEGTMSEKATLPSDEAATCATPEPQDGSEGGAQAETDAEARLPPPTMPLYVTMRGHEYRVGVLVLDWHLLVLVALERVLGGKHSERLTALLRASQPSRTHPVHGKLYLPVESDSLFVPACAALVSFVISKVEQHINDFCRSLDARVTDAFGSVPASLRVCQSRDCGAAFHYSRAHKTQCPRCHKEGRPRPAFPTFRRRNVKTEMRVSRARKKLNDAARAALLRVAPSSPLLGHTDLAQDVLKSRHVLMRIVALARRSERLYTALERWGELHTDSHINTVLRQLLA